MRAHARTRASRTKIHINEWKFDDILLFGENKLRLFTVLIQYLGVNKRQNVTSLVVLYSHARRRKCIFEKT